MTTRTRRTQLDLGRFGSGALRSPLQGHTKIVILMILMMILIIMIMRMTKLMMMSITIREGNFTRSSIYEVDEKEIFRGDDGGCGGCDGGGGDDDKTYDDDDDDDDDGGGGLDKNDPPGDENSLSMRQTYTHRFQCRYLLHRYPFDTQVLNCSLIFAELTMST